MSRHEQPRGGSAASSGRDEYRDSERSRDGYRDREKDQDRYRERGRERGRDRDRDRDRDRSGPHQQQRDGPADRYHPYRRQSPPRRPADGSAPFQPQVAATNGSGQSDRNGSSSSSQQQHSASSTLPSTAGSSSASAAAPSASSSTAEAKKRSAPPPRSSAATADAAKQAEADAAQQKPVFLTRKQREALALQRLEEERLKREEERRQQEQSMQQLIKPQTAAASPVSSTSSSSSRRERDSARGRDERREVKKTAEEELREREMALLKAQHLGQRLDGASKGKTAAERAGLGGKSKFHFEWSSADDTSCDPYALYERRHESALLFGRGFVGGVDRRMQRKEQQALEDIVKKRLQDTLKHEERKEGEEEDSAASGGSAGDGSADMVKGESDGQVQRRSTSRQRDDGKDAAAVRAAAPSALLPRARADKEALVMAAERHWSQKRLEEMTERDWRIFKEDFEIATRGSRVPPPLRDWKESGLPPILLDTLDKLRYRQPTPIQRAAIPVGLMNRDVIGIAETGSGKCFARGTQLRLYSGDLIAVEHIVGGELLMGDDGTARTVTPGSLTPRGSRDVLYTIRPSWEGAEPFTVNGDHILVLAVNKRPWISAEPRQGLTLMWWACWFELDTANVVRLRRRRYDSEQRALDEVEILTADWEPLEWEVSVRGFLAAQYAVRHVCKLMAAEAVTFVNPQLPRLSHVLGVVLGQQPTQAQVDWAAWYLGVWLTGGSTFCADISQGDPPQGQPGSHWEIFEELHRYQLLFGEQVTQQEKELSTAGRRMYEVKFGPPGGNIGSSTSVALRLLTQYGLIDDKHVPQAWLCDTLDVRRRIFAGIMDGDCWRAAENTRYEISAKELRVAQGYKLLGASLGLRTGAIRQQTSVDKRTGQSYGSHCQSFSGDMHRISLHMVCSDKKAPQPGDAGYVVPDKDSRCYGFSITQQPVGEYFGFAVHGGSNRRFLLGDFTITHNVSRTARTRRPRSSCRS